MKKYIILIRSFSTKIIMKEFKEELGNVKVFKNLKTFFNTGNIILDFDGTGNNNNTKLNENEEKDEIQKEISNILTNKHNMDNPLMSIINLDQFKSSIESNPYDDVDKTVLFFPIDENESLDESVCEKDKDHMTKNYQYKILNGIIYYLGPTSGEGTTTKIFRLIIKNTKSIPYTFRTFKSATKILNLATKD